jgi:hypothetical protein
MCACIPIPCVCVHAHMCLCACVRSMLCWYICHVFAYRCVHICTWTDENCCMCMCAFMCLHVGNVRAIRLCICLRAWLCSICACTCVMHVAMHVNMKVCAHLNVCALCVHVCICKNVCHAITTGSSSGPPRRQGADKERTQSGHPSACQP